MSDATYTPELWTAESAARRSSPNTSEGERVPHAALSRGLGRVAVALDVENAAGPQGLLNPAATQTAGASQQVHRALSQTAPPIRKTAGVGTGIQLLGAGRGHEVIDLTTATLAPLMPLAARPDGFLFDIDLPLVPCEFTFLDALTQCGLAVAVDLRGRPTLVAASDLCLSLQCLADTMANAPCTLVRVQINGFWVTWGRTPYPTPFGDQQEVSAQGNNEIVIATSDAQGSTAAASAVAPGGGALANCSAYASGGLSNGGHAKASTAGVRNGRAVACGGGGRESGPTAGGNATAEGDDAAAVAGDGGPGGDGGRAVAIGDDDAFAQGGAAGRPIDGQVGDGGQALAVTTTPQASGKAIARGGDTYLGGKPGTGNASSGRPGAGRHWDGSTR